MSGLSNFYVVRESFPYIFLTISIRSEAIVALIPSNLQLASSREIDKKSPANRLAQIRRWSPPYFDGDMVDQKDTSRAPGRLFGMGTGTGL